MSALATRSRYPQDEKFAYLVGTGSSASDAFRQAYPDRSQETASVWAMASQERQRLASRIAHYHAEVKRAYEGDGHGSIATKAELAQYATRALRTPLAEMERDSDLLQEIVTTTRTDVLGNETVKETVKAVNKLGALGELAKLAGHYAAQKLDVGGNLQVSGLFASVAMASGGDTVIECDTPDYSALLD